MSLVASKSNLLFCLVHRNYVNHLAMHNGILFKRDASAVQRLYDRQLNRLDILSLFPAQNKTKISLGALARVLSLPKKGNARRRFRPNYRTTKSDNKPVVSHNCPNRKHFRLREAATVHKITVINASYLQLEKTSRSGNEPTEHIYTHTHTQVGVCTTVLEYAVPSAASPRSTFAGCFKTYTGFREEIQRTRMHCCGTSFASVINAARGVARKDAHVSVS